MCCTDVSPFLTTWQNQECIGHTIERKILRLSQRQIIYHWGIVKMQIEYTQSIYFCCNDWYLLHVNWSWRSNFMPQRTNEWHIGRKQRLVLRKYQALYEICWKLPPGLFAWDHFIFRFSYSMSTSTTSLACLIFIGINSSRLRHNNSTNRAKGIFLCFLNFSLSLHVPYKSEVIQARHVVRWWIAGKWRLDDKPLEVRCTRCRQVEISCMYTIY